MAVPEFGSRSLEDLYILGEQLGWGQFGVIRACEDRLTGEAVACKSIAKDRLITPDVMRSVRLEIEIMGRLTGHPNVVGLKAVFEEAEHVHIVMELCAGGELFHRLAERGAYTEYEAKGIFRHLMGVVAHCHSSGIVHRDLKPENILLATRSDSSPIKLADFGLATYIKQGESLYGTVGSPFYIAPEVLTGGYNQAADVWSAGVILYILLSGMPPFWGKTKSRIFEAVRAAELHFPSNPWDYVSASAKDLITKMLCKDPSQRLTAMQVLDHAWLNDHSGPLQGSCEHNPSNHVQFNAASCSFTTPLSSTNRDFSFGPGSPLPAEDSSPAFTCKSSFSSFNAKGTPCSASRGFSFSSLRGSTSSGSSHLIPSMPSFTFFSPTSLQEEACCSKVENVIQRDLSFGNLFTLPGDLACVGCEAKELNKAVEVRRAGGFASPRELLGIHNKRNHTIGFGELEQLELAVTESMIRWASCTNLPTAPSLQSSLVC
ncbi:Calcium-dependent protein kinase 20 [Acorus calamus]|uniref:Calcium-dependent protein kinase 20 n=1 Tax=Acorus calamus TaxID=4465 RepID=A0AAV9F7N3_ACOCL|nr:Calcium-dependent protein kinase 20 [Acorus calamus]